MKELLDYRVPSSDGIHSLAGKVYVPDGTPRGILHVVHGMTEYIDRYDPFMRQAAEAGYLVCGYDHLGHGRTARDKSELGFIAHRDGWRHLAADVRVFSDAVRAEYGGELPYYLMGHSMGSFVVRVAAQREVKPDKLVVMGTGGANPLSGVGLAVIGVNKLFCGEKHISPTVYKLIFGTYNSRFKEERDPDAWLTKDTAVRCRYREDDFCNYRFTVGALGDLVRLNRACNSRRWFRDMGATSTPILLVAGSDDPVGNYGRGVNEVYRRLKRQGADVCMKLYPDCRHEILNDSCRDEAVADILSFLAK